MSSEEEIHMLPSFCEGIPSDMSPSEWFGVISDVASGIITRDWRKGDAEAFSGVQMEKGKCGYIFWRRGSSGEREMLRHFLEMGFIILAKKEC